eukprot:262210-Alexandrium_andersonii.AAC.1
MAKSLKAEETAVKDPPRVVFQQASQYEERMAKELEKSQKQRAKAEEELERLQAKELSLIHISEPTRLALI